MILDSGLLFLGHPVYIGLRIVVLGYYTVFIKSGY